MKRGLALGMTAILAVSFGAEKLEAGFGDAVAGGIVGGVVGSVITNEIYHSGSRRHYRSRHVYHRRHRAVPQQAVDTDEMKIQRALQSLGYYRGPIDGQINAFSTRNAIKAFNRAYEISDTAYLSPQERDALVYLGTMLELDHDLVAQGNDSRTKTRRIQAALKVLGFYNGKLDGSTGPMTRRAIASYRQANGLPPSTRLGYEDEYRLVTTAKQSNDRNIQETLASLKQMGTATRPQPMGQPLAPAMRQPVILQPAQPQAPVQPTITQSAPAAPMPEAPAPVAPQPVTQQAAPAAQPAQALQPEQRQKQTEPVIPQPAQ